MHGKVSPTVFDLIYAPSRLPAAGDLKGNLPLDARLPALAAAMLDPRGGTMGGNGFTIMVENIPCVWGMNPAGRVYFH